MDIIKLACDATRVERHAAHQANFKNVVDEIEEANLNCRSVDGTGSFKNMIRAANYSKFITIQCDLWVYNFKTPPRAQHKKYMKEIEYELQEEYWY